MGRAGVPHADQQRRAVRSDAQFGASLFRVAGGPLPRRFESPRIRNQLQRPRTIGDKQ